MKTKYFIPCLGALILLAQNFAVAALNDTAVAITPDKSKVTTDLANVD